MENQPLKDPILLPLSHKQKEDQNHKLSYQKRTVKELLSEKTQLPIQHEFSLNQTIRDKGQELVKSIRNGQREGIRQEKRISLEIDQLKNVVGDLSMIVLNIQEENKKLWKEMRRLKVQQIWNNPPQNRNPNEASSDESSHDCLPMNKLITTQLRSLDGRKEKSGRMSLPPNTTDGLPSMSSFPQRQACQAKNRSTKHLDRNQLTENSMGTSGKVNAGLQSLLFFGGKMQFLAAQ